VPSLRPKELVDAILDAIAVSGEAGVLISRAQEHPRRFAVSGPDGDVLLWVYAWTLTPGGRPQLANEYRIQMTSVTSPLALNSDGPTLLIGYDPDLKTFGGFDVIRHRRFSAGSPSVQIDRMSLQQALQDGLAFDRKSNDEITVAFRPDQFMVYARNALDLHRAGRQPAAFRVLARAASGEPIRTVDLAALTGPRKMLVQTVRRASRAANFSDQVLQAYDRRCAITRVQLRLVEAAHILPVKAPDSPDHVVNGISLSPTYHRAFDAGLIYLSEDREMKLNSKKVALLSGLNLDGGLDAFRSPLGRIHLPPDQNQWPDVRLIRRANTYRQIG
jgi:putative restriction endonuclease